MTNKYALMPKLVCMDTRQKIITTAIPYFNKYGYAAATLFELSKKVGITRGNLTYHFKDKEELLKAIVDNLWHLLLNDRARSAQLPSFENLHYRAQRMQTFQRDYAFIFLDTQVLNHAHIKDKFRTLTTQVIDDHMAAIAFSLKIGNMKPEQFNGQYRHLAFVTWMVSFFWLPQRIMRGEKSHTDVEKVMWSLLLPHFTDKGIASFVSFFGEDYISSIGEPFKQHVDQLLHI